MNRYVYLTAMYLLAIAGCASANDQLFVDNQCQDGTGLTFASPLVTDGDYVFTTEYQGGTSVCRAGIRDGRVEVELDANCPQWMVVATGPQSTDGGTFNQGHPDRIVGLSWDVGLASVSLKVERSSVVLFDETVQFTFAPPVASCPDGGPSRASATVTLE